MRQRHSAAWITRVKTLGVWVAPVLFLGVFFFYPLAAIFRLAGEMALEQGLSPLMWAKVWRPLSFTFWQAALSTLLTVIVGLPAAYVFGRFTFPGKRAMRVLTTLPFILPTVVVAAGFNALLGGRGWVNLLLMRWMAVSEPPLQIMQSLQAIVLAHVFYNTTIVIRVVGQAWAQLDPRLEQAGRSLGASPLRNLWEVTLPLLRPAILSAGLLVFLFDFTSFGVILLLGGPRFATLEVEIYIQALQRLNLPLAGLLSAIQLICTLLMMAVYTRLAVRSGHIPLSPWLHGEGTRSPRGWRERLLVGGMTLVLIMLLVSPLVALGVRSITRLEAGRGERSSVMPGLTLDYYRELFQNRRLSRFYVPPLLAARNSLLAASGTVALSLPLGFLAAYGLARRSSFSRQMEAVLMLPLGASAVTLGLGFLVVFTRPPLDVRNFPFLIPIAHSLVALPFVVRALQPALVSIPVGLRQAAAALGASPWQVWRYVDLPILSRAVLVAIIFSFTISMGEFGATTFLSRPEMPTLPVAIFRFLSQPGGLNYGQAMAMATLLMLVCGCGIVLLEKLGTHGRD
ncbi:MAG: iron ABC transporter permease [Anaerolineaceae bacterium]|nr:iron ABC transporter permease [Anaerolineaceae bacterium]